MLGLTRREVEERFDEIVAFAELERFIDAPVKTYSSGMYMRLGFAVAIHVDPDVLLIDEVLAVGDEAFTRKCLDKIGEFRRRGKTILLVTHSLGLVEKMCDEVLWLRQGTVADQGDPKRVVDAYLTYVAGGEEALLAREHGQAAAAAAARREPGARGARAARATARAAGAAARSRSRRCACSTTAARSATSTCPARASPSPSTCGRRSRWRTSCSASGSSPPTGCPSTARTPTSRTSAPRCRATGEVRFVLDDLRLVEGTYLLDVAAHRRDGTPYDYHRGLYSFRVKSRDQGRGRLPARAPLGASRGGARARSPPAPRPSWTCTTTGEDGQAGRGDSLGTATRDLVARRRRQERARLEGGAGGASSSPTAASTCSTPATCALLEAARARGRRARGGPQLRRLGARAQGRGPARSCRRPSGRRRCAPWRRWTAVVVYDEPTPREVDRARCCRTCWSRAPTGRWTRSWAARRWRRAGGRVVRVALVPGPVHHRPRRADPRSRDGALDRRRWPPRTAPARAARRPRPPAAVVRARRGLVGPARLLAAAARSTERPLLVVVPRERDVEAAAEDLRTLAAEAGRAGAGAALPGARARRPSAACPGTPTPRCAARPPCTRRTAAALRALVASPAGLLRPTLTRRLFETRVVSLRVGRGDDARDPARGPGRGRLPPRGPGDRARAGGAPRRHPRRLPARPRRARAPRVPRRHRWRACAASTPRPSARPAALDALEVLPLSDVVRPALRAGARCASACPSASPAGASCPRSWSGSSAASCPTRWRSSCRWCPEPPCPSGAHLRRARGAWCSSRRPCAQEAEAFHERAREERDAPRRSALALEPEEALVGAGRAARAPEREPPRLHLREVDPERAALHVGRASGAPLRGRPPAAAPRTCAARRRPLRPLPRQPGPRRPPDATCCARTASPWARTRAIEVRVGALSAGFELPERRPAGARRRRRLPRGGPPPPAPPARRAARASSPTSAT